MANKIKINSGELKNIELENFDHLSDMQGAAVENNGTATIGNSVFTANTSTDADWENLAGGGAIYNKNLATIQNSTFSGNTAASLGGAISNIGTVTISGSTFCGNTAEIGGAIYNYGTAKISASTFFDNSSEAGSALYNDGTVTISDSSFSGKNTPVMTQVIDNENLIMISGSTFNGNTGSAIYSYGTAMIRNSIFCDNYGHVISNEEELTIIASSFSGNQGDWGVAVNNYAIATIDASSFSNNIATGTNSFGGAIINLDVLSVSNSSFSGNSAKTGGAIYNTGTASIQTSIFSKNYAAMLGAGIYNSEEGILNIQGSQFIDNVSDNYGSAITNDGNLTIQNGSFSGNFTEGGYGAIENNDTAIISASSFSNNTSGAVGAIYNSYSGIMTIRDSYFSGNQGLVDGAAVCSVGTLTLQSSTFSRNSSDWNGALSNAGSLDVTASHFNGNTAMQGGAIFNNKTAIVSDSDFSGNQVSRDGGAVYNENNFTFRISGSTFSGNRASNWGGAIYNSGDATISASTFSGNHATNGGGAIYNAGLSTISASTFSGNSCSAISNSGTMTVKDLFLETASDTIENRVYYNEWADISNYGTINIEGSLNFGAASGTGIMISNEVGCTLNFDVSNLTASNETPWISDWSRVDNRGNLTITVNGDQILGTYKLADKFALADKEIRLVNPAGIELGRFSSVQSSFTVGQFTYTLNTQAELCLTVAAAGEAGAKKIKVNSGELKNISGDSLENWADLYGGAVENYGVVTVDNSQFRQNISTATDDPQVRGGGAIYSHGTVTCRNSTFSANSAELGGAIFNNGTVAIAESNFNYNQVGGSQAAGAAIYNNGIASIHNSLLSYNASSNRGGAVFNLNSVEINASTCLGNMGNTGGAIYNADTATLNAATFLSNSAAVGGAVFNAGTATINNSLFTDNLSHENGAALHNCGSETVGASTFTGNTAFDGGAIYNTDTAILSLSDSSFCHNTAAKGGGAISNWSTATLTLSTSNFSNNSAESAGGAINNHGKITVEASTFSANVSRSGGAIYSKGQIAISGSTFDANRATARYGRGGAIYNSAKTTISDSSFSANQAFLGGAISNYQELTIANSTFSTNCIVGSGGAIHNAKKGILNISNSTFKGNSATEGGAIYNIGTATIGASNFSGNSAANQTGAISNIGIMTIKELFLTSAGDIIQNTTGESFDDNKTFCGKLTIAGKLTFGENSGTGVMLTNAQNCTLNFDISNLQPNNEIAWISDWSRVDNQGSITITVNNKIEYGAYKLAANVANFDCAITIKNTAGEELGQFAPGADSFKVKKKVYTLTREQELTLTVSDGNLPPPPLPPHKVPASDLDGNGISDVMFQYTGGDNQLGFWMNGTADWQGGNPSEPKEWEVVGAYDMDNSGKADVVMLGNVEVNGAKGAYVGYRKDGDMTSWENISFLANPDGIDWQLKVGNLTGNPGKNSLVWHAPELGACGVWQDGTDNWKTINGYFDQNWKLLGTGDFSGYGRDEILFQNGDGYYSVDIYSNFRELGHTGTGWELRAIGDFRYDGKDDLVFFHQATGSVMMYQDGTTYQNMGQLDAKDWFIVGAGDYNGDKQDDLLVRQYSTGTLGYYASGEMSKWIEMGNGIDTNWTVIA